MDTAGDTAFALLVVIFSLATYGLALSLESVTDALLGKWLNFRNRRRIKHGKKPERIPALLVVDEESLETKV